MKQEYPQHIAIIMDGNGRWAKERLLPRLAGHRQGVKTLKRIVRECGKLGIRILTVYAFSSENWSRPKEEVYLLMKLLRIFAARERQELNENNVRVSVIGDLSRIPTWAQDELQKTIELTKDNKGLCLQLALSYSGRDEIVRATKRIIADLRAGKISEDSLDEDLFSSYLDTAGQPKPDLVIRTSGEVRTSNFLIWQSAYSEFYFTNKYWPDFNEAELHKAIEEFHSRERRYGGLGKTAQSGTGPTETCNNFQKSGIFSS